VLPADAMVVTNTDPAAPSTTETLDYDRARLRDFIDAHPRLFVITGAGCSTDSGIPDYRDTQGGWKRPQPVTYQAFMGELRTRQRYWARSQVGWRRFGKAQPNAIHDALARLEQQGRITMLLTQNVDGLHQAAGHRKVIDLHGRLDEVRCMTCAQRMPRDAFQQLLVQLNPTWARLEASDAPDGDADLDGLDFSSFDIPPCPHCGGIMKPDVVFFGEGVPRDRVDAAITSLNEANALLIVGSSLMVYSGYRFVASASKQGKPVVAVNIGLTRADPLLSFKIEQPCAEALAFIA
jgi:NAD-dependent SIR2 family protein deacetylase